jgi:hypothetical protein
LQRKFRLLGIRQINAPGASADEPLGQVAVQVGHHLQTPIEL